MAEKYTSLLEQYQNVAAQYIAQEDKINEQREQIVECFSQSLAAIENDKANEIRRHEYEMRIIQTSREVTTMTYNTLLQLYHTTIETLQSNMSQEIKEAILIQKMIRQNRDTRLRQGVVSKRIVSQLFNYYETYYPDKFKKIYRDGIFAKFTDRETIDINNEIKEYLWLHRNITDKTTDHYLLVELIDGNYCFITSYFDRDADHQDEIFYIFVGTLWELVNFAMKDEIYDCYLSTTQPVTV